MAEAQKLPPMETEFTVHVEGDETHQTFSGDFKYRRPSIGDRGLIEVNRARLTGDQQTIAADTSDLMYVLAFLKVTLRACPDWWEAAGYGSKLYDTNVVLAVYDKCLDFEKEWKRKVQGDEEPLSVAG